MKYKELIEKYPKLHIIVKSTLLERGINFVSSYYDYSMTSIIDAIKYETNGEERKFWDFIIQQEFEKAERIKPHLFGEVSVIKNGLLDEG